METPNVISSTVNFVKKYPITLCGFSLLFMPSVYRLLLYFTPLLISTAIFIVAMMNWGPSMSSSERVKRSGKRNDWAFNGSLKIYDEEDDEEEGEEEVEDVAEVSQKGKTSEDNMQQEDISIKEEASNVKHDPEMKLEPQLQEPDPDYDEESKRVGTASSSAISAGQDADRVGAASYSAGAAEPDPDLHVGAISYNACAAEPDPDFHAEQHAQPADDRDFYAANHLHAAPDHQPHLHAANHHHLEPAAINPDQHAASDSLINYHDAEPDHLNYHDAEPNHLNYDDDAEPNHLEYHDAEPDTDLHGECAVHAKAHVENDHLHAAILSGLRQKLGMPRGEMLSHQLAERLQTLQAAA